MPTKTATKTKHLTKTAIKTDKHLKTFKVAHRHPLHVKIAKVSKPVKTVTAAPAPMTWFPWTQPSTVNKPVKTYAAVSQFWTWKPEEFLARGPYKR